MAKFFAFLGSKLLTTKFVLKLVLFASAKLVKSSKPKWDDELHALISEALK